MRFGILPEMADLLEFYTKIHPLVFRPIFTYSNFKKGEVFKCRYMNLIPFVFFLFLLLRNKNSFIEYETFPIFVFEILLQ